MWNVKIHLKMIQFLHLPDYPVDHWVCSPPVRPTHCWQHSLASFPQYLQATKIFAILNEKHLTLSDHNSGVNNNRKQWILTAADAGVGRIHCLKGGEYELNQYQEVQDKLLNIFVFIAKYFPGPGQVADRRQGLVHVRLCQVVSGREFVQGWVWWYSRGS